MKFFTKFNRNLGTETNIAKSLTGNHLELIGNTRFLRLREIKKLREKKNLNVCEEVERLPRAGHSSKE